ncbi:MAG: 4'-phosphopantetheinyl transferase superfamily protein [Gemmatimonadota bacterium]|uniref:4'-phosphopantetheinyl transferase family protein n=1 Tax=Candidatus Palauibacter scopulicola TaxID=3056741 RepID=UPI00239E8E44|nr:4'-phosphopantetheinyl transferase superfamily protein [Candidatus Palauibacter scopulicola]MDE2664450.1 4'-phosphopantetheinyl transferase superfamily protein [Candidatus Palauibacter scopulicola]
MWRIDLSARGEAGGRAILSPDERARAERLVNAKARARFRRARIALRRLLSEYLRVPPGELALEYGEHGKPRLVSARADDGAGVEIPFFFNLSHSGGLALCAVGQFGEIGVDIERIRPLSYPGPLARDHLSPEEWRLRSDWETAAARPEFFRIWARKEAILKAAGLGLSRPLGRVDTIRGELDGRSWWLMDLFPGEGFTGAVACSRAPESVRQWSWPS